MAATAIPDPSALQSPWAAAGSGAVQGAAQNVVKQVVLHPLDTIKTRVQTAPGTWAATAGGGGAATDAPFWRSALFRDLYRGFLPSVVGGTPGSAAFFAAKEAAASSLKAQALPKELVTIGSVVAGVLTAKAIRTPFDVAETRAMAAGPSPTGADADGPALAWDGSLSAIRQVYAEEGLRGLYRGYGANVAYKLPADAVKFLAYEALRGTGAAGILPAGVAGAAATLVASAATTPLDVVRTRVLINSTSGNVLDTLNGILATGDSGQLWAGLGWRIARGLLAGAIQFSVLEETKNAVEGRR